MNNTLPPPAVRWFQRKYSLSHAMVEDLRTRDAATVETANLACEQWRLQNGIPASGSPVSCGKFCELLQGGGE